MTNETEPKGVWSEVAVLKERVARLVDRSREHSERILAVERELIRRINYVYGVIAALSMMLAVAVYLL